MLKKGFTIIEVSILFVIFLIVAFLAAPLSLDETVQAKNISRWRDVQEDFTNIYYSVRTYLEENTNSYHVAFDSILRNDVKTNITPYKIAYLNGNYPKSDYKFEEYRQTYSNAVVAYKLFDSSDDGRIGIIMYDVNGAKAPNVWGKDVFGLNIYSDRFEPFCKQDSIETQKQDCSKRGTGLCCSNYYLVGGDIENK